LDREYHLSRRHESALNNNQNGTAIVSDELVSARERKRQNEERAKAYYDKIRKQEAEVADLQKQLTLNQRNLADLQRQKSDLDKQMSNLQHNIDATNHTIDSLQRDLDGHKQNISADQTEMEKYNSQVQQLDHVIADLMRRR
jgi:chromosome segregation ATPase